MLDDVAVAEGLQRLERTVPGAAQGAHLVDEALGGHRAHAGVDAGVVGAQVGRVEPDAAVRDPVGLRGVLGLERRQADAGLAEHLEAAHDADAVVRVQAGGEVGVDVAQGGVGVGQRLELGAQGRIDGRRGHEAAHQRLQVQARAARDDHPRVCGQDLVGEGHEGRGVEGGVGSDHVEPEVGHGGALGGGRLGGADVEAAVDLHGVGREHHGAVGPRGGDGRSGLAGGGGPPEHQHRQPIAHGLPVVE
ncbi:MAG: hypothetical protein R3F59_36390 [Myxococcota bacterium]